MKTILAGALGATTLVATLVWATTTFPTPPDAGVACLTRADVLAHQDRSRNGISLTCDDGIRLRHLAREAAR